MEWRVTEADGEWFSSIHKWLIEWRSIKSKPWRIIACCSSEPEAEHLKNHLVITQYGLFWRND